MNLSGLKHLKLFFTMTQKLTPARVFPPGRTLSRELEARNWTQKDLAEIMDRPVQAINAIVKGTKQITPETALELAAAFGTSDEFWTNLETNYQLHLARQDKRVDPIARKRKIYDLAPISEMMKRGWLQATTSIDDLEQQVCNFFDIATIDEPPVLSLNFRCSQERNLNTSAQLAWVKQVEKLVKQQTVAKFDRDKLEVSIPQILACSKEVEAIAQLLELLKQLGIYFVIVPHLPKTYLDGATFWFGQNPVVALTLRYDRIDSFWFTLMHELGHIVAGHQGSYWDDMDNLAVNREEEEANQLAADWLIRRDALQGFLKQSQAVGASRKAIEKFAEEQERHPGIVLGRLHRLGVVPCQNLRGLLVKVSPMFQAGLMAPDRH
jgi:HTH-type transcriptional regulator / antitoxin HigA